MDKDLQKEMDDFAKSEPVKLKYTKEMDVMMKYLFEEKHLDWKSITKFINKKFSAKFSPTQLYCRYDRERDKS